MLFKILYGLAFLNLLGITACTESAKHSNPLDPESPLFTTKGHINGRVTTLYQPYLPLITATVKLEPGNLIIQSDASGRFEFTDLDSGTFSITASASGFQDTSISVAVVPRQTSPIEIRLNGLPVIESTNVTSAKITTRELNETRFSLEVFSNVLDPDGANDIKTVEVIIPESSFADSLIRAAAIGIGRWQRTFLPEELSALDFSKLVGSPFQVVAHDFPGVAITSEPFFLARVISEVPEAFSPTDGVVASDAPVFRWQLPQIEFSFTQRIEVFRFDAGFPVTVTTISNIKPDVRSLPYIGRLSTGTHFWTITIIDDFGNSSRSKEATFQVQ